MNKKTFIVISLIAIIITGCATSTPQENQKKPAQQVSVHIEVTHEKAAPIIHTNDDTWRITYSLSKPVVALSFDRSTNKFRHKKWHVTDAALEIRDTEEEEIIVSKNHVPFDHFSLTLKTDTTELDKDYNFFFQFKDGSLLLYTGHFNLASILDDTLKPDHSYDLATTFSFVPVKGETLYVAGKRYNSTAQWNDSVEEGTYVFWGKPKPLESETVIGIIDKGLPKWLHKKGNELFPKLFDYYAEHLGRSLGFKPIIFFGYKPSKNGGLSNSGNALPGLIQLEVEGDDWQKPSQEGQARILKFLAHETAHLWNSKLVQHEENVSWMHEGGAEIFAYAVLRDFGLINQDQYYEHMTQNFNQCVSGLEGIAIKDSSNKRRFRNYYTCGTIIGLMTDIAMREAVPRSDGVLDFWKALFDQAAQNKNTYTQEMYFSLLLEKTRNNALVAGLRKLVNEPHAEPGANLASLLGVAGLSASPMTKPFPKDIVRDLGKKAMREIMLCDCHGVVDFSEAKDHLVINGHPECDNLKASVLVDKIGGLSITDDGASAYEYVYRQSTENKPIKVGLYRSKKTVTFNCAKIQKMPVLYRVQPK